MFKRRSKRRSAEPSVPRRRPLIRSGLAAAAVLAALWAGLGALNRPIRTVTVSGRFAHVTPHEVERAVASQADGKGLLTVSLAAVRSAVAALPWVARASVRRVWPDALAVRVREQVALARWNGTALVNRDGVVFVRDTAGAPRGLPRLSGPTGSSAPVTRRFLRMSGELEPEGFGISALALDARGTWQFTLNDGITVRLGRSQLDERFEKFITVALGIVKRRAGDISYIDMRYMNGFAIGWRAGAPRDASPAGGPGAGGRDA
jgi:cell division protein FtsQ